MNDVILAVAKDLPSTAVLILFVYVVNKQFSLAIELIRQHLADINKLLEKCIETDKVPRG